jgi:predicted small lipoprotein YifL
MRSSFLAVIGVAVLSASLAGCGSTPYELVMSDRQHAEDEKVCTGAGFKPGTNQYEKCLQDQNLARMRRTAGDAAAPK